MTYALSIRTERLGQVFGGATAYWYGVATMVPFAQAAGDALDDGINVLIFPSGADDLFRIMGISAERNSGIFNTEIANEEHFVWWAAPNADGGVGINVALVLPLDKYNRLDQKLTDYHPTPMMLFVTFDAESVLRSVEVGTGSSRQRFLQRIPFIERQSFEFAIAHPDLSRGHMP